MNNPRVIYCFWTGDNAMSDERKKALDTIIQNTKIEVILINKNNINNYIIPQYPLHPAYDYLSSVHKSDYLRTYFMHHYGGGYTDIKPTVADWSIFFDQLYNSDSFGIGYTEVGSNGVAILPNPLGLFLKNNWKSLLGNGAYIFKGKTEFTNQWINSLNYILDIRHDLLKLNPATTYRDCYDENKDPLSQYPLKWSEILGDIFHPLCYKYKEKLMHGLIPPQFYNYK